jgi:AAA domain, putative AbiEii toxin, Type IV TA system
MRITKIFVRFYKSFNYDYERKFADGSKPDPWETLQDTWYPYVRLDLEPSVTTIVGANESGKSHLLDSIEKVITGEGIDRSDFCRYSHFFSVEQGQRRSPDFGAEFEVADDVDVGLAKKHLGVDMAVGDRFNMFRPNGEPPVVYLAGEESPLRATARRQADPGALLPGVFRLDANIPLPASIPLHELAPDAERPSGSRRSRRRVLDQVLGRSWSSSDEFAQAAPGIFDLISDRSADSRRVSRIDQQYELGRNLLFRVARIDPTAIKDLSDAIADEREGYVNGIIQKINSALAVQLNFPRWWAQDRDFRLMVSPREYDLVFTIRDRTGTDYSFSERSYGLRYFLSYHVQLLAHRPQSPDRPEILLMDEPDAFLSSQGQQDLLRILEEFASPEDGSRHDQVIYATHSPFLINRNAGERIRVLDKGVTDEGTRVVRDVARNHYEPLRSSLGTFVGETAFIGGSNLFVEGLADQVLLAGISSHLKAKGVPALNTLDLNSVTIVPAGSASSLPYLVYLARGRDVIRPPCVALLDSDTAGEEAVKTLTRGGPRRKEILPQEFVLQVGAWATAAAEPLSVPKDVVITELEDLIPLPVAVAAARNYAIKVVQASREHADTLVEGDISAKLEKHHGSVFDALKSAFVERLGPEFHIEKVGFAKEVVAALSASRHLDVPPSGFSEAERNFELILSELAKLLRRANQEEQDRRLNNRLQRIVKGFLSDYPASTSRERGRLLVEEVQGSIEESDEGDWIRLQAEKLRRDFHLDESLTQPIDRFDEFRDRVAALQYEERFVKRDVYRDTTDAPPVPSPAAGASSDEGEASSAKPDTFDEAAAPGQPRGSRRANKSPK